MKLQDRIFKFMYGRNGMDLLGKVTIALYLICMILTVLMPNLTAAYITLGFAFLFAVVFIYRSMSKNLAQRRKENEVAYRIRDSIKREVRLVKNRWKDRKTHVYKKCPKCKKVLRMKRTKGKHSCNCPHCGTAVEVTVRLASKKA